LLGRGSADNTEPTFSVICRMSAFLDCVSMHNCGVRGDRQTLSMSINEGSV
jgi:hypothetical protein